MNQSNMKTVLRILAPALILSACLFLAYQSGHQRAIVHALSIVVLGTWLWAAIDGIRAVRRWRNTPAMPPVQEDQRSPDAAPNEPPKVIHLRRGGSRRTTH